MNPDKIRLAMRMLNAFENDSGSPETDYKSVYIYHDGKNKRRQVTLARGFTDDGGNLKKVLERYILRGGAQQEFFAGRLKLCGTGVLVDDKEFLKGLGDVSAEPAMREAQDDVFESEYLQPALNWSGRYGFKENLSQAVIIDSYLHSGSMRPALMDSFAESKPSSGGDEKDWVESYVNARLAWFKRVTGALHNCTYRPEFFLGEIKKGNWAFDCPLRSNGTNIC